MFAMATIIVNLHAQFCCKDSRAFHFKKKKKMKCSMFGNFIEAFVLPTSLILVELSVILI